MYTQNNSRFLETLPPIPPTCVGGLANNSKLELPEGTKVLQIKNLSKLESLPPFPSSLEEIYITNVPIKSLPMLQGCSGLRILVCKDTHIHSIPELPATLEHLDCSENLYLKNLPELRYLTNLKYISLEDSRIERLETLPDSVQVLKLNYSRIKMIRNLPENLKILECNYCPIKSLDQFPQGIQKIHLYWTLITHIPPLPEGLLEFHYDCHMSHFIQPFPILPLSLLNLRFMERNRTFIFQLKNGEIISDFQNTLLTWSKDRDFVRNVSRCKCVKGDLIAATWHPDRYQSWCLDIQEKNFMSKDRSIEEWLLYDV
jgi:Leucine-rich repeat (LRR) protein